MTNNENAAADLGTNLRFYLPVSAAAGLAPAALSAALLTGYSGIVGLRLTADSLLVVVDLPRLTLLGGGVPDLAGVAAYVAALLA